MEAMRDPIRSIPHVRGVHVLGPMQVRLLFSDGLVRDLGLEPLLAGAIFGRHRSDPGFFARARVERGTLAWPDGSALDPLILHGDEVPAMGEGPRVLAETAAPPVVAAS